MKPGIGAVIWCSALSCAPISAWAGFAVTWAPTQSALVSQQGEQAQGGAPAAMSDWRATWESQTSALRREASFCASAQATAATAADASPAGVAIPAEAAGSPASSSLPGCWTFIARHAQVMSSLWEGRPALAVIVRYFQDLGRLARKCQAVGAAACMESSDALRVRMDKESARLLLDSADQ